MVIDAIAIVDMIWEWMGLPRLSLALVVVGTAALLLWLWAN